MKCIKCKREIMNDMFFCPFCGQKNSDETVKSFPEAERKLLVDKCIRSNDYNKIYEIAKSGCSYAKYIYLQYLTRWCEDISHDLGAYTNKFPFLKEEAEKNIDFAMTAYGVLLVTFWTTRFNILMERNNPEKRDEGIKFVVKAADKKECAAEYYVSIWNGKGKSFPVINELKEYRYIKDSSDKGFPPAMELIGEWYSEGSKGIKKDETLGLELHQKAVFWGVGSSLSSIANSSSQDTVEEYDAFRLMLTKNVDHDIELTNEEISDSIRRLFLEDYDVGETEEEIILKSYKGVVYNNENDALESMKEEFDATRVLLGESTAEELVRHKQYIYKNSKNYKFYDIKKAVEMIDKKIKQILGDHNISDSKIIEYSQKREKAIEMIDSFQAAEEFANYDTILSANGIPETVIESVKYCIEKRIRIEFKKEISDYCEYEGKKNDVKSTNYIAAIVILIISIILFGVIGAWAWIGIFIAVCNFFSTANDRLRLLPKKRNWETVSKFVEKNLEIIG